MDRRRINESIWAADVQRPDPNPSGLSPTSSPRQFVGPPDQQLVKLVGPLAKLSDSGRQVDANRRHCIQPNMGRTVTCCHFQYISQPNCTVQACTQEFTKGGGFRNGKGNVKMNSANLCNRAPIRGHYCLRSGARPIKGPRNVWCILVIK